MPLLLAAGGSRLRRTARPRGEEAAGRLELFLAQPVDRRAVFLGRAVAALVGLIALTLILTVVQFGIDAVVDLRIDSGYLLSTILLCALLAALHGSVAFAMACLRSPPIRVLGLGIGVALAGYLVAALFPLSSGLEPWQHISPWDWAFGGDPLGERHGGLAVRRARGSGDPSHRRRHPCCCQARRRVRLITLPLNAAASGADCPRAGSPDRTLNLFDPRAPTR